MEIFIKDISHINDKQKKRAFTHDILMEILADKIGCDFEIIREKNKKPFVKNNPVYFNISHSHNMLAIAVAKFEVGIDIEYIKKRDFLALSKHHFKKVIDNADDFYKQWTEFEAGIKLYGGSIFNHQNQKPKYLFSKKIGDYMLSAAADYDSIFKISSLDNDAKGENK